MEVINAPMRGFPNTYEIFEDFVLAQPFVTALSGTGSSIGLGNAGNIDTGGFPGWATLSTGTTSAGRAALHPVSTAGILLGNGLWVLEALIKPLNVSDGTETFTIYVGFNDNASALGTDAVMFRYTHSVNSGKYECVTRSNGVETATDSGVALVAATDYKLRIEINATATEVKFYINNALVATNTTNIPVGSGRQTAPFIGIIKSAGTTNREFRMDYVYIRNDLTVVR